VTAPMQTIRQAWRARFGLPLLVRVGAIALVVGLGLDVGAHLIAGPAADGHLHFSPAEHLGHLVVVAGMALVWAGVVVDGARHHRFAGRDRRQQKERQPCHSANS